MAIAKRIFFFAIVNILVLVSVSIAFQIASYFIWGPEGAPVDSYYSTLLLFSALFGMMGSIISLFISKWTAKRMMGLTMVDESTRDARALEVVQMVHSMARAARLPKMPEVGIYNSPEMNAFATGPSKSNSLVAVSTGLMNSLDRGELEAVIGHEVAHIKNGDMVTLTLIQGIVNTFVIFFSRVLANIVASQFERNRYMIEFALIIVMQIVFGLLGSIVVNFFSRWREYRADAGGARYSSRQNMINALKALGRQTIEPNRDDALAAFKISGPSNLAALFRTHPPLEARIARLESGR